jgi:hypothetical protein
MVPGVGIINMSACRVLCINLGLGVSKREIKNYLGTPNINFVWFYEGRHEIDNVMPTLEFDDLSWTELDTAIMGAA